MKFAILSAVLAGASLVAANAAPEPVFEKGNFRFGHAMGNNAPVEPRDEAKILLPFKMPSFPFHPIPGAGADSMPPRKQGCRGRFRSKAIAMANTVRVAFGFAPIEAHPHMHHHHNRPPKIEIVKMEGLPFIGAGTPVHAHHNVHGLRPIHSHFHHANFSTRLNHALRSLGPWEGGAIAFVFGCGIGVLLRMFFVLIVVAYRGIRGRRSQDSEQVQYIVLAEDAEEIFVAPPQYNDEKVQVANQV